MPVATERMALLSMSYTTNSPRSFIMQHQKNITYRCIHLKFRTDNRAKDYQSDWANQIPAFAEGIFPFGDADDVRRIGDHIRNQWKK